MIKIRVRASLESAILLGATDREWDASVDPSKLTNEQRIHLAELTKFLPIEGDSSLLAGNGQITPEAIQASLDKANAKLEKDTIDWLAKPYILNSNDKKLTDSRVIPVMEVLKKERAVEDAEKEKIRLERCAKEELANKLRNETNARMEEEKKKEEVLRMKQLAEAVARLGTAMQKERWEEGVMPRAEAIDLIVKEATKPLIQAGYEIMDSSEYHVGGEDPGQTQKRTLSDGYFAEAKKIRSLMPGWKHTYWIDQSTEDDHEERQTCVYIKLSNTIGVIDVVFDVELKG